VEALESCGLRVLVGREAYRDIDELEDVLALQRLWGQQHCAGERERERKGEREGGFGRGMTVTGHDLDAASGEDAYNQEGAGAGTTCRAGGAAGRDDVNTDDTAAGMDIDEDEEEEEKQPAACFTRIRVGQRSFRLSSPPTYTLKALEGMDIQGTGS
jgi:hypothetical protein